MTYQAFADGVLAQFEVDLTVLFETVALPKPLDAACRYAMAGLGKRARPLLAAAAFHSVAPSLDTPLAQAMLRRACLSVELLHGYSLVHDDLPCMDDSALRRGRATCHIAHGEAVALLAGDVLQSLAFEVLSMPLAGLVSDDLLVAKLSAIFAPRARRMVAGQMLDVMGEGQDLSQSALEAIHRDKTGALIEASVLMGGAAAGADAVAMAALADYARYLGLAFQVQDDVLDAIMDADSLGKPTGHDEKLNKSTYVKHLGVAGAQDYANALFTQAFDAVAYIHLNQPNTMRFDDADNALLALGAWVQNRKK